MNVVHNILNKHINLTLEMHPYVMYQMFIYKNFHWIIEQREFCLILDANAHLTNKEARQTNINKYKARYIQYSLSFEQKIYTKIG